MPLISETGLVKLNRVDALMFSPLILIILVNIQSIEQN